MQPTLASSALNRLMQVTGAGYMMRTLIGRAALAVAVTGALATVAAAPPRAAGPSTSPPVARVIVKDVRVPVPGQRPVPAYLVRSAGALKSEAAMPEYCSCTGSGRFTATEPNFSPKQ